MRTARISWRRGTAFALLLVLVVPILAACGGGGGATPATSEPAAQATTAPAAGATAAPAAEPTAAPAAEPTAAPAASGSTGGTLRLLWWQAPTILNSHLAQGTKDQDASRLVLEPLAAFDQNGTPAARLAEEIPTLDNGGVAADFTSVTWKLKKGLKWSDGSDFTADDVIFTWQYCADEKTACTDSVNFEPIESVEAVDPTTIKITWTEPNPDPYTAFVGFGGAVLQKAQFADCVGEKAATCPGNNNPIGTGPYMVKEFKPGDSVSYVKNPNYRDAAKVAFDAVEMKGGGDAVSAARASLETGDVDYAWNLQVEPAVLEQIMQAAKGDLVAEAGGNSERLLVNFSDPDAALGDQRGEPTTKHPILSDIKVREALSIAIDRKTIQVQNYGAAGTVTCNVLTAPPDVTSSNTKCDQDIAKANQLLDEAGWKDTDGDGIRDKDGKPLRLVYQTTVNPVRQKTQAIIKANWKEIGVDTELKSVDSGVFFSSDAGNPDTAGHFFADIEMFTTGNDNPDPTTYMDSWTCDNIAQKSNEWRLNNYMRWCNQEYTDLIAKIKQETDKTKRAALFIQANDILVADFAMIPLIARQTPSGKVKELQGPTGNQWDTELWNIAEWTK